MTEHTFEIPETEKQKLTDIRPELAAPASGQRVDVLIRSSPWASAIAAAAIGFALGTWCVRR